MQRVMNMTAISLFLMVVALVGIDIARLVVLIAWHSLPAMLMGLVVIAGIACLKK
jgi:hypothetical protein